MTTRKTPAKDFAPEGEIAPVHKALLRFAKRPGWILPRASFESCVENIARNFNFLRSTQDGIPPRFPDVFHELRAVETAAKAYAAALRNLNEFSLTALVGDAPMREPDLREPKFVHPRTWEVFPAVKKVPINDGQHGKYEFINPDTLEAFPTFNEAKPKALDDVAVAFSSEIGRLSELNLPTDFIDPTIARAMAMARIAQTRAHAIEAIGPDKGGTPNLPTMVYGQAKLALVKDCFWLVADLFGEAGAEKCTPSTGKPGAKTNKPPPPFAALLAAIFNYATGDISTGIGAGNFEWPMKQALPSLRKELAEFAASAGRPFPLKDQIEAMNERPNTSPSGSPRRR